MNRASVGGIAIGTSLLSLAALVGACSERPTSPLSGEPVTSVAVSGLRINDAEFRSTGSFAIGIVARTATGTTILNKNADVTFALDSVSGGGSAGVTYSVVREQTIVEPSGGAARAVILIDNSNSMTTSDPRVLRASAARLFWETILPANTGNQVAILDFGVSVSPGFTNTRLMQTWTAAATTLESAIAGLGVGPRGTPLFESLVETSTWMSSTTVSGQKRLILLLTDGQPTGTSDRTAAISSARAAGITIHAVGLGPASDLSAQSDPAAVAAVHDVAEKTNGVYAAATEAIALAPVFKILATVSNEGQLVGRFRISPVPTTGKIVSGTLTVISGGRVESVKYSFRAP